jgi:hypothetical protein
MQQIQMCCILCKVSTKSGNDWSARGALTRVQRSEDAESFVIQSS